MVINRILFFRFFSSICLLALHLLSPCTAPHLLHEHKIPESFSLPMKNNQIIKANQSYRNFQFILDKQLWSSCSVLITIVSDMESILFFFKENILRLLPKPLAVLIDSQQVEYTDLLGNTDLKECGVWYHYIHCWRSFILKKQQNDTYWYYLSRPLLQMMIQRFLKGLEFIILHFLVNLCLSIDHLSQKLIQYNKASNVCKFVTF